MLAETIDARRHGSATPDRTVVLLVDGIGALRSTYDSLSGLETLEGLERVAAILKISDFMPVSTILRTLRSCSLFIGNFKTSSNRPAESFPHEKS